MANLKVTIVIRPTTGNRTPVPANGKTDPPGSYYLRFCVGKVPRFSSVKKIMGGSDTFHDAEIAQYKMEQKLLAESQGFTVREEAPVSPEFHRCEEVLKSYLNWLRTTRKKNGRRYTESSVVARESDIRKFIAFSGRVYVEQITGADILRYKQSLYDKNRAADTVLNKLICITSWLRKNQVVCIKDLISQDEFPAQRETDPNPYSKKEIEAMMKVAGEHKLLLRLFLATGMRKSEVAHAEKSDLKPQLGVISVNSKPHWNWETKTPSSVRNIPISASLMNDLLALPGKGLLFPNKDTKRPECHLERIVEAVAVAGGVVAPEKADWCHRWRDTYATDRVREKIHDLRDIARFLGHSDLKTVDRYAKSCELDSPESRQSAENADPYAETEKPGPQLVKGGKNAA
jgi:integrase